MLLLGGGRQHSPKDIVPNLAGNTETELKVLVVMSEVVSLHFTKVSRETGVVKRIVAWTKTIVRFRHARYIGTGLTHVIDDIHGKRTRDDTIGNSLGEDEVCKLCKRRLKDKEQQGRHNEPQLVHREIMVNTVEQEMESDGPSCVGQVVVEVEEESVHTVFKDGPDEDAECEAQEEVASRGGRRDGDR